MVAVAREACKRPVRRSQIQVAIAAHTTRELERRSELTAPINIRLIINKGSMGPIRSNKLLFECPAFSSPLFLLATLEVEGGAPAATPDPTVFLDHPLNVRPCRGPEPTARDSRLRRLPARRFRR